MAGLGTYAYLNARLRAKLGKLLSAQQYEQLMQAAGTSTLAEILLHTDYHGLLRDISTVHDLRRAESALVGHLIACHREVAAHAKGSVREFVEELMRKYEVENLKVILRAWNAGEETEFIYRDPICHAIPVTSILKAGTIEEVIVLLDETPYRKPLVGARERYKETGSLFYLEMALDKELYEATWRAIEALSLRDKKIASRLIGIEIDILNINWILRFKRYYDLSLAEITSLMIPRGLQITEEFLREVYPGKDQASLMSELLTGVYRSVSQRLSVREEVRALHFLEALLRETFVQQIRSALRGYPFTIGVAIAYLRLKKMEVSNIVTILNGKALRLPREDVERNLVRL